MRKHLDMLYYSDMLISFLYWTLDSQTLFSFSNVEKWHQMCIVLSVNNV